MKLLPAILTSAMILFSTPVFSADNPNINPKDKHLYHHIGDYALKKRKYRIISFCF